MITIGEDNLDCTAVEEASTGKAAIEGTVDSPDWDRRRWVGRSRRAGPLGTKLVAVPD